jgi:hypothetical protein
MNVCKGGSFSLSWCERKENNGRESGKYVCVGVGGGGNQGVLEGLFGSRDEYP